VPDAARRLADAFWPGPLTLVVRRAPGVLDAVTGGQGSVAVRVPGQPVALELLRTFGGGVAAPSANRFGRVSPTTAPDVRTDLGDDVDLVLDDGPSVVGVESTIVSLTEAVPRVLRLGGLDRRALETVVGTAVLDPLDAGDRREGPRVPGTMPSHYAPRARVLLESSAALAGAVGSGANVGVIVFGSDLPLDDAATALGRPADAVEYARTLYRMLRAADEQGIDLVVAVPPGEEGIGAAVADRLRRAAAPRPAA